MVVTPDSILFDTNILVYAANKASPFYDKAKALRGRAERADLKACVSLQNLWEFYAVITDSKRVEHALPPQTAREEVEKYLEAEFIVKLPITEGALKMAIRLGDKYKVPGQRFFDLLLVGTMVDCKVLSIYTANSSDFEGIEEIKVINPFL